MRQKKAATARPNDGLIVSPFFFVFLLCALIDRYGLLFD
jgi:hypothetical protein